MLAFATAASAAPDAVDLIKRLVRQAPASIAFVEVRFSPLLVEPLVVAGELDYEGADTLRRRVQRPFEELTTIHGESVRVERNGESPRMFALRRAPELRGLLTGMIGLLAGDASSLDRNFSVVPSGDDAAWRLDLTPTDGRTLQRLQRIVVSGADREPNCFVMRDAQGGASVMLLGAAANRPMPQSVALAELLASCNAE